MRGRHVHGHRKSLVKHRVDRLSFGQQDMVKVGNFCRIPFSFPFMGNTESTSLLKCVDKNGQLDQERYFHYRRQVDNVTQEHHKAAAAVSDVNSKKIRTPRHRSCKCKERGKVCDNGMFVFIFCC